MTDKPTKRPNDPKATGRWENEGGAPRAGDISEQRAHAKRPRDPNQLAKTIVGIATGEITDEPAEPQVSALARKGGLKGGKARAAALRPDQRSEIARAAAAARWKKGRS
jgi:hypothetical protein